MKRLSSEIGNEAETTALKHLQHHGLTFVDRNYRCRRGEIDLIMEEAGTLIFIEVKYRQSEQYGSAAEMVTQQKQRKIITTALHYLQQHKLDQACRFDVVAISPNSGVEWIKGAFEAN